MKKLLKDGIMEENEFICMILQCGDILRVQTGIKNCNIKSIHKNMQNGDVEVTISDTLYSIRPDYKHIVTEIKDLHFIVRFNNKLYLISKHVVGVDVYEEYVNSFYFTLKTENTELREVII